MPPIGGVIIGLIIIAVTVSVFVALVVHALIPRYWLACTVVVALVLLGCMAYHFVDSPNVSDVTSIALLYGVGVTAGLVISAIAGFTVRLIRLIAAHGR